MRPPPIPSRDRPTDELHRRNIYYTDLPHLLAAYGREHHADQDGFGGQDNPTPPPCPWHDRGNALRRDGEVERELERSTHRFMMPINAAPYCTFLSFAIWRRCH